MLNRSVVDLVNSNSSNRSLSSLYCRWLLIIELEQYSLKPVLPTAVLMCNQEEDIDFLVCSVPSEIVLYLIYI